MACRRPGVWVSALTAWRCFSWVKLPFAKSSCSRFSNRRHNPMRFEFFLAKRFLVGQRFGVFRLITTTIAVGGIALGVAALLITLAVMDGFRADIQEKILGTQPHVFLVNPFGGLIENDPAFPKQLTATKHVE